MQNSACVTRLLPGKIRNFNVMIVAIIRATLYINNDDVNVKVTRIEVKGIGKHQLEYITFELHRQKSTNITIAGSHQIWHKVIG